MRMFYPDRREKSAYTIDYADLYRKGYRGVIFDIDNTLVPHGAPATKEAAAFFASLRETGFSTCLLSNRVESLVPAFTNTGNPSNKTINNRITTITAILRDSNFRLKTFLS